jgi:hypothetical protein
MRLKSSHRHVTQLFARKSCAQSTGCIIDGLDRQGVARGLAANGLTLGVPLRPAQPAPTAESLAAAPLTTAHHINKRGRARCDGPSTRAPTRHKRRRACTSTVGWATSEDGRRIILIEGAAQSIRIWKDRRPQYQRLTKVPDLWKFSFGRQFASCFRCE